MSFRVWLNQLWLEHKDEVYETTGKPCDYDLGLYFNKYKWWLKRMYIKQHGYYGKRKSYF